MRQTKRIIAFALAFMMFMTNTVSASATSLSSGSNINGTTMVSSDTMVDTDENGSTDLFGKGETAEPSGEDASSQDGANGGSDTTDNGQTTPEGNTPSTDSTGEESSEDTSQSASTEETTEETSEETVEETTEEETTEVIGADLLKDETSGAHTTKEDGDVVSVDMSETTYYFASIAAAIDYVDDNGDDDYYYIFRITDQILSVSGDDLVTNKNRKITLDMSKNISVSSSSSSSADTARINIGLDGDGKLIMGEHTSLQLIHNEGYEHGYSLASGGVQFPETNAGDLIIGEENEVYDAYMFFMSEDLTIENAQKIYAYAPFQWGSLYSDDNQLSEKVDLTVKNLTFDVHTGSSSDYVYPVFVGGSITAENFTLLSGQIEIANLTVSDTFLAQDGEISIYKKADIHDLTVPESSDPKKIFRLYRVDSYTDTVSEDNLICAASIHLSGKLDINHYMNWLKADSVREKDKMGLDVTTSPYAEGDTLATVTLEEGQDIDLSPFMALEKYAVVNYDGTSYELAASEVIGQENTYALKMVKSSNMITLEISDGTDTAEKGFATLADVKDYINTKANANRSYSIRMNQPATASGSDLDYYDVIADTVSLDLNGNKLTLSQDAIIALDFIDGFKYDENVAIAGTSSQIDAKTKSIANLSILPRKQYASVKGISILTAANTTTLTLGGDHSGSNFSFDASVSGKLKGLYLKGNVDVLSTTAVSAAKVVVDRANNENGRAYFANLQADALYMEEGNVEVGTAAVSGTLTISEECGLTVAPAGTFTVKDIEIIDGEDEGARANIELQRRMTVTDQEDPSLEGAKQAAVAGTLKITGNVALADQNPLGVRKTWVYQKTTDEGTWDARGGEEDFISGETIATVTNTKVPASYFAVESQNGMMTVERSGSLLKAVKPTVRVIQRDYEWNDIGVYNYKTLEDAVKNMVTDFDGSASGCFDIVLLDNVKLTANVTIPAFVKELQLVTEETEPDTDDSPVYAYSLDLNGKTLTTTAYVDMSSGVRMKSSVAASGKFVINYSTDGNSLKINECRALVDKDGNEIADRPSVLDNVIVTAKYAHVNLNCDTVRAGSDHGMTASFDVHDIFVEDGNWTLNTMGKTASYVKTEKAIILNKGTSLSADQIKAAYLTVWQDASLSADQMTLSGKNVEVYGKLETDTLTLTGAYVDINKLDESCGYVEVGTLTATNSEINMQDNDCQLKCKGNATLTGTELGLWGGNITVNGNMSLTGSSLELQGTLDVAGNITSATSRIRLSKDEDENRNEEENRYGNLYVNDLTINSAYAGDASGDYTLDNECCVLVKGKLTMKAGTLRNADIVEVKTANVKDMVNEGSFLCDTFTNTGKLTLKSDSVMLINKSGTVNNVVLDYGSEQGNASLGRGNKATVALNGTFTAKQEDTQLNAFVTDEYLEKVGNTESKSNDSGHTWIEYSFDWIELWDNNGTPDDDSDDHDQSYVGRLALGTSVFSTGIKTFPVENINVLPWKYNDAGEGETANWVDNDNNAVYQSGKELLVAGNCIHVCVEHAGGETAGEWKNFSSWNDAVTYIDSLNNASAVYKIEISADTFDIGGTMTLPTKASKVIILSAYGYEEGEEWITQPVKLWYQGDITQKTDLLFENIHFVPYKMVNGEKVFNESTIDTKGKALDFSSSYIYRAEGMEVPDGHFKAIKGTKTTSLRLMNESRIVVDNTITGIDRVELINGSYLGIKKGGLSVNDLYAENGEDYSNPNERNTVYIYDKKSVIEVKNTFDMVSKTYVHSGGTMKFKNISSNCEGNILETDSANSITITGSVYSWDGKALSDTTPYVAVYSKSVLLGYRTPTDYDYKDTSSGEGTESESQEKTFKDDLKVIYVPKYAIRINTVNSGGDILATAAAVSSSWFITDKDFTDGFDKVDGINLTRKEDGKIWRGEKASAPITLSEVVGHDDEDGRITAQLDQFDSLQEAFNEIDRLGNTKAEYLITLNGISDDKRPDDVTVYGDYSSKSVRVADKNVNSKNRKTIDYTFPSKAAEVVIESDWNNGPQAIVYSKNLTLKTNLTLENVALYAENATEKSTGTIALGGNRLILNGVYMQKNCNAFTGSGVTKGSVLIVDTCDLRAAKVSQISLVELARGSRLLSAGEITIGDLTAEPYTEFGGFGKITIGNIEAEGSNFTLYTKPKFTADKNGVYTKSEPTMTVSGSINGDVIFGLTDASSLTDKGLVEILDDDSDKLETLLSENGAGVAFVKAPNASTENIVIISNNGSRWENGTIYKKSGNFVFKNTYPQVELSYAVDDEETAYSFETYADAINEINTLKTKRDYTITFLEGDYTNPTDVDNAIALTMPKAGMADTLTLTADCDDVYIKGDITMNTNVVLEDIDFVQVITEKGENYPVKDYVTYKEKYVNPLNIKVNGAYELRIQDEVTFNNAIALNGAGKAFFTMSEAIDGKDGKDAGSLKASYHTVHLEEEVNLYMQGTIKNFAEVNLYTDCTAFIMPYESGTLAKPAYKPAEVDVTALNVPSGASLEVGGENLFYGYYGGSPVISTLKVKELNAADDSEICVWGTAAITAACLGNNTLLAVAGQTFNITGTLTVSGTPLLQTTLGQKTRQSVLNISGKVVRTNPNDKVQVDVFLNDDVLSDWASGEDIYLGGSYTNKNGKTVSISNKLLTAKNVDASVFIPYSESKDSTCLKPDDWYPYGLAGGVYVEKGHGYILTKSGSDILVHYGDEVEAAVYIGSEAEGKPYGYYTDFNAAVAAIDALKDTNAEYTIEVLQDVGSASNPEKVNLPAKAAKVKITPESPLAIYYNNDLNLGCDTEFTTIQLNPAGASGKEKGINTKGFALTLTNIKDNTGNGEAVIGKITGNGKEDSVTICNQSSDLIISGDVTKIKDLTLKEGRTEGESPAVTVMGKVTVTNLISEKYNWDNKQNKLIIQGKGSSLTNVEAKKEILEIDYPDLNITGEIVADNSNLILCNTTAVKAAMNGSQRNLTKNNVLLTVKNANLSEVVFYMGLLGPDNYDPAGAAWANGAVYALDDIANTVVVKGTKTVSGENESILATCLDMTQASAYINARADKEVEYKITLDDDITDTCVTDKTERSTLTLPKADTMKSLEVYASLNGGLGQLSFTGDVKVNGNVIFRKIKLQNDKDFSFILAKNSDSKVNGAKVSGESSLTLNDARIMTTKDGKGNSVGNIKNITGVKGVSKLTLNDSKTLIGGTPKTSLDLTGGITKVAVMELKDYSLKTLGASDVAQFVNDSDGEWTALGKTTIGSISLNKDAILGTTLVKGVPQLTITGEVTDISSEGGKKVIVKLFDYDSANKVYKEHSEMVAEAERSSCYDNTPLVIAAKAPADLFVAVPYKSGKKEFVEAYKDAKNYVYNGDVSMMDAMVDTLDADGNRVGRTYAKTYADAITQINNIGNKDGNYRITLRNTYEDGNNGVIKTAVKNGVAEYGALALPNANAAASVTIASRDSAYPVTIKYTGTMQPKGKMKLNFDNIILTEGKINAKAADGDGFDEYNTITPVLGTAEVTFTRSVTTPDAVDTAKQYVGEGSGLEDFYWIENDNGKDSVGLVFTKVTGSSGTLYLDESSAFVIGDANVKNLVMKSASESGTEYPGTLQVLGKTVIGSVKLDNNLGGGLICKNAISIGNVIKGEEADYTELVINTAYTQKELTKASSQLSITGEADLGVEINVFQYCYDTAEKGYRRLVPDEANNVLWNPDEKTASYQKLITAPKLATGNLFIFLVEDLDFHYDGNEYKYHYAKVDGSICLTESEPAIAVYGGYEDLAYAATFYSWDQAVKEIDKLGHTDWNYEIKLLEDLGTDTAPLKSLNMPAKAGYVDVWSENGSGILMTGTNVALKTDTIIEVDIAAVKKSGSRYYTTPFTINTGKYMLELLVSDSGKEYDDVGYYESRIKLTGTSAGKAGIVIAKGAYEEGDQYTENITSISNIGTVWLMETGDQFTPEGEEERWEYSTFAVKDGVSGVGQLIIDPNVSLECKDKDVNVKNLGTGLAYDLEENSFSYSNFDNAPSSVTAPNITVSNTLTMAGSELHAGVSTGSDGKVTLKDIVVYDNDNRIYAKQDKNGKSQIKITGTTTTAGENISPDEGAITLGLYYHNSTSRFVQLTDGLVFANAPKAATSLFCVNSAWEHENDSGEQITDVNMGFVPKVEIFEKDENGNPFIAMDDKGNSIVAKDEGGNYIQGWDDEHYVLATDESGNPMFAKNEEGQKIPATDENGNSITDDDNNTVYLYVFYKTVSHFEDTYGLYRLGNDIVYGKLKTQVWDEDAEQMVWTDDMEVRVWIDGDPGKAPYLDFATFEEAVKAIDSMGLQKDVPGTNGKTTKAYLNYTIQFNRNVEIGNEKQNNKYNALTLPSKVSQLTIDGWGYDMTFSGNITLKSNTVFKNVTLKPVKLVKNERVSDDKINLAVGNYKATLENAYFFAGKMPINNVTGSAKGELILVGGTWLDVNGNVTGLNRIIFKQKSQYEDNSGETVTDFGGMWINGNTNVKEIRFEDAAAQMGCMDSLTANMIYVSADSVAQLMHSDATPIKLNGAASYMDGEGNTIKENVSVVIEEAPEGSDEDETDEGADPVDPNCLILYMIPSKADVKTGTKVVTGKYLDNTQWTLLVGAESEGEDDTTYTSYMNGSDICVGSAVTTD